MKINDEVTPATVDAAAGSGHAVEVRVHGIGDHQPRVNASVYLHINGQEPRRASPYGCRLRVSATPTSTSSLLTCSTPNLLLRVTHCA